MSNENYPEGMNPESIDWAHDEYLREHQQLNSKSNIDEQAVKQLLKVIVNDIFTCFEPNLYSTGVKEALLNKIDNSDLLTDLPPSAKLQSYFKEK